MKIKAKLRLGVGLLFGMIALLTIVAHVSLNQLSSDSRHILEANYNSLQYARQMMRLFEQNTLSPEEFASFEKELAQQERNITEAGEQEQTTQLRAHFIRLRNDPNNPDLQQLLRKDLTELMRINMEAIQRKNEKAEDTADQVSLWIALAGTICFLIAFTLLINLPGNIANPIRELTTSIREIAAGDYTQRVYFKQANEFGELAAAFNSMGQKLQEYNNSNLATLMVEKRRIDTLINNMQDPVIGLDEARRIIFMNERALKITGLQAAEVMGRPSQELALHNDLLRSLIRSLFDPAADKEAEPLKIYADGKESFFQREIIPIEVIPTGEHAARHIGDVILLRNITPFKELDFAKTHFIATISHELKTPISAIRMSLHLLENEQIGALNEEQQNLLKGIREDTARLLRITSELLDMTQVESGHIQLTLQAADPQSVLQDALEFNRTAAEHKHIRLEYEAPAQVGQMLADSEKTTWVLSNLVSNALRYSYENGRVLLRLEQSGSLIRFSVQDQGPGIDPQYRERIFERYFRIPGMQHEGSGLGLAICKEFIEAQGGRIGVESEYGRGSTFWVEMNGVV